MNKPGRCPVCNAEIGGPHGVHWNAASIWCLRCGWAQNWPQPAKRAVARVANAAVGGKISEEKLCQDAT